jgi:hypothetical protein
MIKSTPFIDIFAAPEVQQKIQEYNAQHKNDCDVLAGEEDKDLNEWFNNPLTCLDETIVVYRKAEPCLDPQYLKYLFLEMDETIIQQALLRMQPGSKKEVATEERKPGKNCGPTFFAGKLKAAQWELYKQAKRAYGSNPKVKTRKLSKRGFCHTSLVERKETLIWDPKTGTNFPVFAGNKYWFVNKWCDKEKRIVWRAWVVYFTLSWDSFTRNVTFGFNYTTQHYEANHVKNWIYN